MWLAGAVAENRVACRFKHLPGASPEESKG
jgi:hypothetical protein